MTKHFKDEGFGYFTENKEKVMGVLEKLKKNTTIIESDTLKDSKFFVENFIETEVPMVNVALSGKIDGGITSGLTVLAGPSKHFKSSFALMLASAYLKQKPTAALLFYDSEFGSKKTYFETFGIDEARVLHSPIENIEKLKIDIVNQLEKLEASDDVIIVIDSIGNLASKKEVEDALDGKSVADMTRAKSLKSLFRMITPYLTIKSIPVIAVNHTYKEIGMFPKDIVSGGTGVVYSADNIWIIGRQQDKKGDEIKGYHFIINVEKSRYVKEKSKIPISVSWEGGIEKWSGLLEVALLGGYVTKPSNGWYQKVDRKTGEVIGNKLREKDTMTEDFWSDIFEKTDFKEFVFKLYSIGQASAIDPEDMEFGEEADDE